MVSGKTEVEVNRLLGAPDATETLLLGDERWIWWNYTYLGGKSWAPEVRGKVVHLEITFAGSMLADLKDEDKSLWRVSEPYGVGFVLPGEEAENRSSPLNKNTRSSI
jgi:hypothetical protein